MDARKDRLNRRKHRISFDTALHVFDDPYHVTTQDREVEGEPRWQTIGMIGAHNVLLVAHTEDDETGAIRIISARKATRTERRIYAEGN
ncbi:MAG: BrnT family toxin [Candidatus Sulfotelmatobacter sp.]